MIKLGGYDIRNIMKLPRDQMLAFARYRLALKICPGLVIPPKPSDAPIVPPYRDAVQIGISAEVTVTPADFPDSCDLEIALGKEGEADKALRGLPGQSLATLLEPALQEGWTKLLAVRAVGSDRDPPMARGTSRVYRTFKPEKVIVTETLQATFSGPGLPDRTLAANIDNALDVLLVLAFNGGTSILQSPPSASTGIPGQVFGWNVTGNGINNWPVLKENTDLTMGWAVTPSIMNRVIGACRKCGTLEDRLPSGYDPRPRSIRTIIRATLIGPKAE